MTAILRTALLAAVAAAASIPPVAVGQDTSSASLLRRIDSLERRAADLEQRVLVLEALVRVQPSTGVGGGLSTGMVPIGNEVFMEAIVEEKPSVLSGPQLEYPELLKQAQITGRVLVQAIVDTLGRAEANSVKVLQSPNPAFDQSAKDWVMKALFRPARVHGRAVRVLVQIPIDFRTKR